MTAATTLREAVNAACRAGFSVIPVAADAKVPAFDLLPLNDAGKAIWEPYQHRRPTKEELRAWFSTSGRNLGIVCGQVSGGLAVLDIDDPKLADEMVADNGLKATTTLVRTPHGGLHIWTIETEAVSRSGPLVPGVADMKAEGGYILAPPSRLQDGDYHFVTNDTILCVPNAREWAVETLAAFGVEVRARSHVPLDVPTILRGVPEGQRDEDLFRLACKLRHADVPLDVAQHLVLEAAGNCDPPFPEEDALAKVQSAYSRYPAGEEAELGGIAPSIAEHELGEVSGLRIVSLGSLVEPSRRPWRVEDIIPDKSPVIVYGDGGQGKSYVSLAIGTSVATGLPAFDLKVVQAPVLYLDYELDEEEFTRRAYGVARGLGLSRPPQDLLYANTARPLPELIPTLRSEILKHGIGLLVVDSLGPACGGDTQAERTVIPVMQALRGLGIASLAVDHQAKLQQGQSYSGKTPFGSSYKFNLARCVWQLERGDSHDAGGLDILLRHRKSNFGPLRPEMGLRLTFEGGDQPTVRIERSNPAEVPDLFDKLPARKRVETVLGEFGSAEVAALVEELGMAEGTVRNHLTELRRQGKADSDGTRWHLCIPDSHSYIGRESGIVSAGKGWGHQSAAEHGLRIIDRRSSVGVDRDAFRCRQCGGDDLAYSDTGWLHCPRCEAPQGCVVGGWLVHTP